MNTTARYKQNRARRPAPARVTIELPEAEIAAVDDWAIARGLTTRTAAIRKLLADGVQGRRVAAGDAARDGR